MQHVAFNVASYDDLLGMRDRIRDRGLNVFGPVDHGFCKSIYFAGLEGMMLEIATSEVALDERAWIDPEVVELVGIDSEMLERLKSPAAFESQGGAIVNPPVDWSRPQIPYMSKEAVEELMSKPDALPLVCFRIVDDAGFTAYDVSDKMKERGWIVPAYTLAADADHVSVLRVVVREGMSSDMADILVTDFRRCVEELGATPAELPGRRGHQPHHRGKIC